ncbi:MAG: hypothetical protein ACJAUQ_000428 [Maribacter sp.]|jgi:hypothetical protein
MYQSNRTRMYKSIIVVGVLFIGMHCATAQEDDKKEDIGTETVTVTKAYTPAVSDAFKIKSTPNLNDSIVLQKKKIKYSIFSMPVASTFTPSKGTASAVERIPPPELFNSYASLGVGNYGNVNVDFYTNRTLSRDEDLVIGLNHHSTQGGIDGVQLNDRFSNSKMDAAYKKRDRDYNWGTDLGVQHRYYNWYGVPESIFDDATIAAIDEGQNYFMGEVSGHFNLEDSFFKGVDAKFRRFWDSAQSGENRAIVNAAFEFPLNEELFTLGLNADYVGGSFKNTNLSNTVNLGGINYGQLQAGIRPSLQMHSDDLSLNLGVNLVYGMDLENSEGNFYIYPAITASYRLLEETVIAYGGVVGELRQNSFHGFVEDNPFVSPTLDIAPTDSQYNAYIGVKGQLLPNLNYNLKGSYSAENNRPLFRLNPQNLFRNDDRGYYFGNSFDVFYDDIRTIGIFGELNLDVNRNFTLGINAQINEYTTETDNPAWNLPNLEASLFMDYQIGKQWFAGLNLFYVGERDDFSSVAVENVPPSEFPVTLVSLEGFFDANAHVGYRVNDQLSLVIKASNIANNNYQRWANFQVQGLQILGGATYKFNF